MNNCSYSLIVLHLIILFGLNNTVFGQCATSYELTGPSSINCTGGVYTLSMSDLGLDYYLVDSVTRAVLDGPVAGTGNAISFNYETVNGSEYIQVNTISDTNFSLDFDGIDDHVLIPHTSSLETPNAFTIEAWIYPRDIQSTQWSNIYRQGTSFPDGPLFLFSNFGTELSIAGRFNGVYNQLNVPINPADYENQWVHVLAFFDDASNALRLFRNGVEIGNVGVTGGLTISTSDHYIGSFGGNFEFFDGQIDELRVWNYGRWASQITNGMNPCYPIDTSGLVAWYKFDEGSGTMLNDLTNHNNNGTLVNMDAATDWTSGVNEPVSNALHIASYHNIVYVDSSASGSNDGSCWANAYNSLQSAIENIGAGQQIWVAKGTYYPSSYPSGVAGMSNRDYTFHLVDNVDYYGGFAGTEILLEERNIGANPTILSGNIGSLSDSLDNTYNVVVSVNDNNVTMDGFTIQEGTADLSVSRGIEGESLFRSQGGAINIYQSAIQFKNMTFRNNRAMNSGGAIITRRDGVLSPISISNSSFYENSANDAGGGAIWIQITSLDYHLHTVFNNVMIHNNFTDEGDGGGIHILRSDTEFNNVVFSNNRVLADVSTLYSGNGGGAFFNNVGQHNLTNCTFAGNEAFVGSGIFNQGANSILQIDNSVFYGNKDTTDIEVEFASTIPAIRPNNSIQQDPTTFTNSTFSFRQITTDPFDNIANVAGVDQVLGTADDGLQLAKGSELIDDGLYFVNTLSSDIAGNQRVISQNIDVGAYEYDFCSEVLNNDGIIFVNQQATGNNTGENWANALLDLSDALNIASNCNQVEQIWVAQGTYFPSTLPREIVGPPFSYQLDSSWHTFHLANGIAVYGGFDGTESSEEERDFANNPTILSGDIGMSGNLSDNVHHVVLSVSDDSTTILDGFVIEDGNAQFSNFASEVFINTQSISASSGGGIYNRSSQASYRNLIIRNNVSSWSGAGVYSDISSNHFINTSIFSNSAAVFGAGFRSENSGNPKLTNCNINNNVSNNQAGGLYSSLDSSLTLNNCILWGNTDLDDIDSELQIQNLSGTAFVNHTLIRGQTPIGNGNIDSAMSINPMFVDESTNDYRLEENSPLVNAGNINYFPPELTLDLSSNSRFKACSIDIGAYEHQSLWGANLSDTAKCFDETSITLVGQGNSLHWYSDAGLSNDLHQGNTFSNGISAPGTAIYYASDSAINCARQLTDSLMVTIYALPDVNVSEVGNVISAENLNLGATYAWLDCDDNFNAISGETNPSFTATTSGNYAVQINESGCVDTSSCINITLSGLQSTLSSIDFNVSPNPTDGKFTIRFGENLKDVKIEIFDTKGQRLQRYSTENTEKVDLSIVDGAGVYFIHVESMKEKAILRIVKQ